MYSVKGGLSVLSTADRSPTTFRNPAAAAPFLLLRDAPGGSTPPPPRGPRPPPPRRGHPSAPVAGTRCPWAGGGGASGANTPPSGREGGISTPPRHCRPRGLDYLERETRQDLLGDAAGQREVAERLARLLPQALADLQL